MQRAKNICLGDEEEHWDDLKDLTTLCAEFMLDKIKQKIPVIFVSDEPKRSIKVSTS
jgi:hypothetical protein